MCSKYFIVNTRIVILLFFFFFFFFFQEMQIQAAGCEALQLAWETINSSGWKQEKETSHGDKVYSKLGPKGSKIYRLVVCTASVVLFEMLRYWLCVCL